jgi:hypothetical protein
MSTSQLIVLYGAILLLVLAILLFVICKFYLKDTDSRSWYMILSLFMLSISVVMFIVFGLWNYNTHGVVPI